MVRETASQSGTRPTEGFDAGWSRAAPQNRSCRTESSRHCINRCTSFENRFLLGLFIPFCGFNNGLPALIHPFLQVHRTLFTPLVQTFRQMYTKK
jgi:hypothetical protein